MDNDLLENDFIDLLDKLISDEDSVDVSSESGRSTVESDSSLIQKYKRCKANTKQKRRKIEVVANGKRVEFEAFFPNPSSALKYDIRRSYANMMFNVLNSGDFRMFFGFFDEFCVPSFTHKITRTITDNGAPRTLNSSNTGLMNSTKKWQFAMNRTPDASFRIKDSTILTKKDGSESRLVCNFTFQATKVYDDAADIIPDEELYRTCEPDESTPDPMYFGDRQLMLEDVSKSIQEYNRTRLVLRERPRTIDCEGVITLWMDADCMLTRMEMNNRSVHRPL